MMKKKQPDGPSAEVHLSQDSGHATDQSHSRSDNHHHGHSHNHDHNDDHSHSHGLGHGHDSSVPARRLKLVLSVILIFAAVEIAGGLLSGSLALLSDAGHMIADSFAVFMSLLAFSISSRSVTRRHSYGFYRAEILAAFVNGLLLAAYALYIIFESYQRFREPRDIQLDLMAWVGLAGLAVNVLSAFIIHPVSKDNLNARGAYLHILGDLMGSVAVLGAAGAIYFTGKLWFDPLLSVAISALIIYSAAGLIRESGHILMEGAPAHIGVEAVREQLLSLSGVEDVHDLHIWSITPSHPMITAHIQVAADQPCSHNSLLEQARELLKKEFNIEHSTLQVEYGPEDLRCVNCEETG